MTDKLRRPCRATATSCPSGPPSPSAPVGLSPLTMASAYAAFASRGMYCTPIAIESITQKVGDEQKSLEVPKSTCSRAMSREDRGHHQHPAARRGRLRYGHAGRPHRPPNAGKTGTTDERKNAWFVGYTPNMSGAVWVGSATQKVQMKNITIGGVYHPKVYGGQVPGPIWKDAMTGALQGKSVASFNIVDIPDPDKGRGRR